MLARSYPDSSKARTAASRISGAAFSSRLSLRLTSTARGHGRREIRTVKVLTLSTGIDFPHAAQALQIRRRRRRLDQPKRFTTETVYAITDLRVHQAKPAQLATWIRGHWSIENKIYWVRDVTYDEDHCQIRTGTGPEVMAALRNAAIGALRTAGVANIAAANRHHARDSTRPYSASPDDFTGALSGHDSRFRLTQTAWPTRHAASARHSLRGPWASSCRHREARQHGTTASALPRSRQNGRADDDEQGGRADAHA
ncbi:ISAs1 family transposase [Micromonospora saelicesensis]|uniref:ISAs1 family transposase n=1 Tax=Micromonospora saelicesensis TaxID=285676 RepID=UPI0035A23429